MKNAPGPGEQIAQVEAPAAAPSAVTQEADVAAQMEAASTPDEAIQTLTSVPVGRTRKGSNSRPRSVPGVTRKKAPRNAKSPKWGVPPTESSVNVSAADDTEQVTQQLGDTVEADEPLSVPELSGAGLADGIVLPEERDDTANEVQDVPVTKTTVYKRADLEVPTDPRERAQAVADTYKRKKGPIVRQPALQQKVEVSNTQPDTVESTVEAVDDVTSNVQETEDAGKAAEGTRFDARRDEDAERWNEAMAEQKSEVPSIDSKMADAMPTGSVGIGEALKRDLGGRIKSAMQGAGQPGITEFGGQGDEGDMAKQMSAPGVNQKTERQRFREWAGEKTQAAKETIDAVKGDLGLAAIQAGMLKDELRAIPGLIRAGIGRKLNAAGEGTRIDFGGQHLSKREMVQYQRTLTQEEIDAKIAEKVAEKYGGNFDGISDQEIKDAVQEKIAQAKEGVRGMVDRAKEKIDPRDPRFPSKEDIRDQNEYAREKSSSIEAALIAGTAYLEPIYRNTGNPKRKGEVLSYQVSYTDGRKSQQLDVTTGETLLKTQQAGERIQSLAGLERARELMDKDLALVEVTRFGKVVIRDAVTKELIVDEQGEPLQMTQKELMDNDFFGITFADEGEAIKLTKKELPELEEIDSHSRELQATSFETEWGEQIPALADRLRVAYAKVPQRHRDYWNPGYGRYGEGLRHDSDPAKSENVDVAKAVLGLLDSDYYSTDRDRRERQIYKDLSFEVEVMESLAEEFEDRHVEIQDLPVRPGVVEGSIAPPAESDREGEATAEREVSSEVKVLERTRGLDARLSTLTVAQAMKSSLVLEQVIKRGLSLEQFVTEQVRGLEEQGIMTNSEVWNYLDDWLDAAEADINSVSGASQEEDQGDQLKSPIVERLEELFASLEDETGDLESMSNESLTKFVAMTERMINDIQELGTQLEQNNAELYARLSPTIEATNQFIEDKQAEAQELLDDPDRAAAAETVDEAEQVTNEIVNKVAEAIQEFQSGEFDDATYNELFKEVADSKELGLGKQLQLMFQLLSAFVDAISKPAG